MQNEKKMYDIVKKYFIKQYDCKYIKTANDSNQIKIHKRGRPDIVFIQPVEESYIHIAEGKCIKGKRHVFNECVGQLEDDRKYANYLWAFFPKGDWEELDKSKIDEYKEELNEKGIGLLIVDESCKKELDPDINKKTNSDSMKEVFEQFGIKKPITYQFDYFKKEDVDEFRKVFLKIEELFEYLCEKLNRKPREVTDYNYNSGWYSRECYFTPQEDLGIEEDPFGLYLKDGNPKIWIWKHFKDEISFNDFEKFKFKNIFTHLYVKNKNGEHKSIHIYDNENTKKEINSGFNEDSYFSYEVTIKNKTKESILRETKDVISKIKNLKRLTGSK